MIYLLCSFSTSCEGRIEEDLGFRIFIGQKFKPNLDSITSNVNLDPNQENWGVFSDPKHPAISIEKDGVSIGSINGASVLNFKNGSITFIMSEEALSEVLVLRLKDNRVVYKDQFSQRVTINLNLYAPPQKNKNQPKK